MQAKILVVEDVKEMAELIGLYLEKEGANVVLCETGEDGLRAMGESRFDLVVLDINLPGIDGFEFLQAVRPKSSVPIVIVSAREADEDMVMGLGIGADDFVTKPFSPKVLVARIRAILRRAQESRVPRANVLRFGAYSMDLDAYLLKRDEQRIPVSAREFEVLRCLAVHAGTVMAPESVYREVWGDRFGDITIIAVYVQRLRKKIEDDPAEPRFIETVYGKGYRFNRGEVLRGESNDGANA